MSKVRRNLAITQKRSKINAHGVVIIICRKLIFGRMTEVHKSIDSLCWN